MANSFTKNFQDTTALTEAQLTTGYTSLKPSLANMALATTGSSGFQVMRSKGSNVAPEFDDIGDVLASGTLTNAGTDAVFQATGRADGGSSTTSPDIATSLGSGLFAHTSTTLTNVTNLSVSITTSGRPVSLSLITQDTSLVGSISIISTVSGSFVSGAIAWTRDASIINNQALRVAKGPAELQTIQLLLPPGGFNHLDIVGAGTYTYTFQVGTGGVNFTINADNVRLVAYEI